LAAVLGTMPEDEPRYVVGEGIALVGCGPGQWLALAESERQLVSRLTVAVAGAASMIDLTSAKAVIRIAGPRARDVLAKGCGLDLHPTEFPAGSAAATQVDHVACQLWQINATPAYELMVGRSLAKSFWSWLTTSAAEYGYEVR
jgi:sarcosine oxidase subunit gamma